MRKIEVNNQTDILYENGAGNVRALGVYWHENFGLVNLSFYDEAAKELVFAEDFDLQTATALHNRLSQIIEATPANSRTSSDTNKAAVTIAKAKLIK